MLQHRQTESSIEDESDQLSGLLPAKSGHQGWLESGPKDYALSPI